MNVPLQYAPLLKRIRLACAGLFAEEVASVAGVAVPAGCAHLAPSLWHLDRLAFAAKTQQIAALVAHESNHQNRTTTVYAITTHHAATRRSSM